MIKQKEIERWYESAHYRKKSDWICIDQPKVIQEWFSSQAVGQIFYSDEFEPPKWMSKVPTVSVTGQWIKAVTKKPSHTGCIAIIKRPHYPIARLVASKQVVLLDGIQDPGNLGTIIRSMVAFGTSTLCLTSKCADPFHPKCVAASSGTIGKVVIFYEEHWSPWLAQSKLPVFILNPHAIDAIQSKKDQSEYILICGSEGQGIQSPWHQYVKESTSVAIPIHDECESLNAAMSVNIALFHFFIKE